MRDPFSWSFPVARLFGISVKVHTFFPIVGVALVLRIAWHKDADQALRGHPGYDAGRNRIVAALKQARAAAAIVDREQASLARLLNDRLPAAPSSQAIQARDESNR